MTNNRSQHLILKNLCVAILAILGFFAAQFVVAAVMIVAVMLYHMLVLHMTSAAAYGNAASLLTSHQVSLLILSELLFLAMVFLIVKLRHSSLADAIGLKRTSFWSLVSYMILGFILNFVTVLVISLIPFPQTWVSNYVETSSLIGQEGFLMLAIASVLIAPVTEEVLFRGLIYRHFHRAMPRFFAIVTESLIFGALHESPIWILYGFAMGVVLTLVYERKGNLAYSIAVHIGFNLIGIL